MKNKPSREEIFKMVGEPYTYAIMGKQRLDLYTEAQLLAMYAAGAEAMRERAVPDGWQLVPVEPTGQMQNAWHMSMSKTWSGAYRAMLSAAPCALPITQTNTEGEQ